MKRIIGIGFFVAVASYSQGQSYSEKFKRQVLSSPQINKTDIKNQIASKDISHLLTKTENSKVVGFIGQDYRRARIKMISVIHHERNPLQYLVYGKSMLNDSIAEFQGTLTLTHAFYLNNSKVKDVRQGIAVGEYELFESPSRRNAGVFRGVFVLRWYLDTSGQIHYDDLEPVLGNNAFVGIWSRYLQAQSSEICNWGDNRIPMSGSLDKGTKGFFPDEKYQQNGWLSYVQFFNDKSEEARRVETAQWWR